MKRVRQNGFTLIEIMIVIVILGILGIIGWRVWDANVNTQVADQSVVLPNKIKNETDLDKSAATLDNTDIIGDSEQQLNAETDF